MTNIESARELLATLRGRTHSLGFLMWGDAQVRVVAHELGAHVETCISGVWREAAWGCAGQTTDPVRHARDALARFIGL